MSFGTLIVRVTTANDAYPVEGAKVRITGADTDLVFYTDRDGITPPIRLTAPDPVYSLSPNASEDAYATYDAAITARGFYRRIVYGMPIFAGIATTLPVSLIPDSEYQREENYPRGNVVLNSDFGNEL